MLKPQVWIPLAIGCGLLGTVIPWWLSLLIFCIVYFLLNFLVFRWYMDSIIIVQEVTGLDLESSKDIYSATFTGDWSKIPTEHLRTPKPTGAPDLAKGGKAKFKRQLISLIIMERVRREVRKESREMLEDWGEEEKG
jgi:hypothetical protein